MSMRISTKGRYGVRFMIDLAVYGNSGSVPLKEIASREGISEKYLWQIVTPLKKQGLIQCVTGPRGGYCISRPLESITLLELLVALEGSISLVPCVSKIDLCKRSKRCTARQMWIELEKKIEELLASITIDKLAEVERTKVLDRNLFYII